MKQIPLKLSVSESAEHIKKSLLEKGFTLFCDIDHHANADSVDLDMPASQALIFGNPVAGTKLMQKDITISFDLPLRLAIVDKNGQTMLVHQTTTAKTISLKVTPYWEKLNHCSLHWSES